MNASHLDPLPADLDNVIVKARTSHMTNLANVDAIIARLELARAQLAGTAPPPADGENEPAPSSAATLLPLSSFVKTANAQAAAAHKEWSGAVGKLAKTVDKKFAAPPPPLFPPAPTPPPPFTLHPTFLSISPSGSTTPAAALASPSESSVMPFSSPSAISALNETITSHLARIGAFHSLSTFLEESGTPSPLSDELLDSLRALHEILVELRSGTCTAAIDWLLAYPDADPLGDLEFSLRREEFIRLLLAGSSLEPPTDAEMETEPLLPPAPAPAVKGAPPDPHVQAALAYGGTHFRHFMTPARQTTICALLTSPLYMPLPRLLASPYGPLYQPYTSSTTTASSPTDSLCLAFSAAYLKHLGLPRDSPLTVVTDVGGSGAMAKIMKVRAVMKEKKTEWSAVGELPVEIPLPVPYRYHSIFACPVSKEQSTAQNPPMLLPCGHVIARESLVRLARGTPTLKCPYCPVVSHFSACVRVHF
ncbi:hypothetical protein JCM21900_000136 [Sporobolomyces salmonicolor]